MMEASMTMVEAASAGAPSSEQYVVAWPGYEHCLDSEDGFCDLTNSSVLTPTESLLNDAQDSLLDALARLTEERSKSERLQRQVEVARALASLPNDGSPDRAAKLVQRVQRGRAVRTEMAAALAERARRRQAAAAVRTRAASTLCHALRAYVTTTLPRSTKSSLRRDAVRLRTRLAEAREALAKKGAQLERQIERQLEAHASYRESLTTAADEAAARAAEEAWQRANAAAAVREAALAEALAASESSREEEMRRAVEAQQAAASTRARALEDAATNHAIERAELLAQLDEERTAARALEEKASMLAIGKEEAESLASRLLAEKLGHDETQAAGGGGSGRWPCATPALPACTWGVEEHAKAEERASDDEADGLNDEMPSCSGTGSVSPRSMERRS